jgi:hypothetical protein
MAGVVVGHTSRAPHLKATIELAPAPLSHCTTGPKADVRPLSDASVTREHVVLVAGAPLAEERARPLGRGTLLRGAPIMSLRGTHTHTAMSWLGVALLALAAGARGASAVFIVESGSLKVSMPEAVKGDYDIALANFGVPSYGGELRCAPPSLRRGFRRVLGPPAALPQRRKSTDDALRRSTRLCFPPITSAH